jgi:plasmid stabilization system protein ParE
MRVRWTADAADDLERICDYIAEDLLAPRAAWRSP